MNIYLKFPVQIFVPHSLQLEWFDPINYSLIHQTILRREKTFLPGKFL